MASTFLDPTPHPDDGVEKPVRRCNRHHKEPSFLLGDSAYTILSIGNCDYSRFRTDQLLTFLNPAMSGAANETSADAAELRTVPIYQSHDSTAQAHLPSCHVRDAAASMASNSAGPRNYTHNQTDIDKTLSMAGGGTSVSNPRPKVVPPHMRKVAIASSATAPAQDISKKLSRLGVKVSKPEPCSVPAEARCDYIAQAPSQTQANSASSEKKSSDHAWSRVKSNGRISQPPPWRSNDQGRGRGRGGRARGAGGVGMRGGSRWPTSAEQRPDPNRWTSNWDFEAANANTSSIDTMWADCGVGQSTKRAAANPESYNLADFSGGWAPAPINWDARPSFTDPKKVEKIEKWIGDTTQALESCTVSITQAHFGGKWAYEFAPRYWKPFRIEPGVSPSQWFARLSEPRNPKPIDEDDLKGLLPWWDRYLSSDSNCITLQLPVHPLKESLDPDMNEYERLAYERDEGAQSQVDRRKNFELAKREAKARRQRRTEEKARKLQELYGDVVVEKIKPKIKLFIRSATKDDMVAVRDIYNYYVRNACVAPEMSDRSESHMYQRLMDVRAAELPFLVACERGAVIKARRRKGKPDWDDQGDIILHDKVVGFAYADDWSDRRGMYRFTAELQVFVASGSSGKGVGKCLLDKLIGVLDQNYLERGGFEVEGTEIDGTGRSRLLESLVINCAYDDPHRLEWIGRWLENWLEFRKVSDMPGVGSKNGKSVSLAHFMRKTGVKIDHANPPVPMPETP